MVINGLVGVVIFVLSRSSQMASWNRRHDSVSCYREVRDVLLMTSSDASDQRGKSDQHTGSDHPVAKKRLELLLAGHSWSAIIHFINQSGTTLNIQGVSRRCFSAKDQHSGWEPLDGLLTCSQKEVSNLVRKKSFGANGMGRIPNNQSSVLVRLGPNGWINPFQPSDHRDAL